jgi:hypothetical protein
VGLVPTKTHFISLFLILVAQTYTAGAQGTDWTKLHAQDDASWAARSALSKREIRKLRVVVGINDNSSDFIDNIDAKTLSSYGLVLFASYSGSARCVNFWLLSKAGDNYKEFWKSEDGGEELNFCADPKCDTPLVKAKPNRDMEVEIPSWRRGKCVSDSYALLKWTRKTYSYEGILTRTKIRKAK